MNTKFYIENDPEKIILRDHLAFDRTVLAVERTILSYIRTALVATGGGITFLKLFHGEFIPNLLGWVCFVLAILMFIFGGWRFFKSRQTLKAVYETPRD